MPKMMQIPRPRLRALTLAEFVGIAAVLIAALGYWDSHRERVAAEKAHQDEAAARALKETFLLKGEISGKGGALRLVPVHSDQVIQTQTLWFPKAVRADKVETTGDPRLEADWIADGVRHAAGGATSGRAPVAVQTVFIQDGQTRTDQSVYELAYSLHHRLLQSDQVKLEGLSLARRAVAGDPQAAAEKLWAKP